jgi:para-nitrobenzyl esterase
MKRKHLLIIAAVIFCSFIIITSAWAKPPEHARNRANRADTIVETNYGRLMGDVGENNTWVWKGVPYAKPPVGNLRWKAPEDPDPWQGVRQAKKECVPCTQLYTTSDWVRQDYAIGSEDCLYLNIWRPQSDEILPVYVWIHGGSNNFGMAADYNGSVLASTSNVVVVVIQYRLGPLGWFTHPALRNGNPEDNSGNYGTLDTIKALEWIQENIESFGGTPNNVTITGESAGAHNVMNLVISPLAKNLFHKAMSQSGGMVTIPVSSGETLANSTIDRLLVDDGTAENLAEAVIIREGMTYDEIESYLRQKTSYEIYEVLYGNIGTYSAYQDGIVIPGSVVSTIRSGNYNKVPIIVGANEYETKAFLPLYGPAIKYFGLFGGGPWPNVPSPVEYTWLDLIGVLDGDVPSLDDVLPTTDDKNLYEICGYYGSRTWRAKFVDERAKALHDQQDDVYAYQFNWGGQGSGPYPFNFIYGAGHAMEIAFFFGSDTSLWGYSFSPGNDTAGRLELQEYMMKYLANFCRTGNPNVGPFNIPFEWDQWSNTVNEPKVILFDSDSDKAILEMSLEEVTFSGVETELFFATLTLPEEVRDLPWYFQWHTAEP